MCKIFHLSIKLIANDLDIDKRFESIHQSVKATVRNFVSGSWVIKTIAEHDIKIFEC